VINVVGKTLANYCSAVDHDDDDDDDEPCNIVDALLSAAIDDKIHLDCVYFLLRREPDALQELLPFLAGTYSDTSDVIESNIKYNNNNTNDDAGCDDSNVRSVA
jgi:hypothetical protein